MVYSYQEFISRNWIFINKDLQTKISKTKLFFAGCGLGSVIAETAVRTGFLEFLLADGDKVKFSNLNRQIFTTIDIGKNKAEVTAALLKKINPLIETKVINFFIKLSDVHEGLINDYDYIINTLDVNKTFFELNKEAINRDKTVLVPLNIGFGSFLMVFTKNSKKIEEIVNTEKIKNDLDFFNELIRKLDTSKLPNYISSSLQFIFDEIKNKGISPQLGIAANVTASLTILTIIKLIAGQSVPLSPTPILIDLFEHQ
jgi:molybdopterin/thiamine biosynthesis adenylyltransferase